MKIVDTTILIPEIIYAIEEPETSQHTEHQKKLIKAFLELSNSPNTQIIITTHSASLVKELKFEHLRLVKQQESTKSVETISPGRLPYPSLNEVNYLAFNEINEKYHNELYGFIESIEQLPTLREGEHTVRYLKERRGNVIEENIILTDYIRHQIHHPENTLNTRYTFEQLSESISFMRTFIEMITD